MRRHRPSMAITVAILFVAISFVAPACGHTPTPARLRRALGDDAITIGSFDFPESALLAELYGRALEAGGYHVRLATSLGPREFVLPALAAGLVELVPEYAGTSIAFLSLGAKRAGGDIAQTHADLVGELRDRSFTALAPAAAQDANTFVVDRRIAEREDLHRLSDLSRLAPTLTFGGPPECPTRPLCLAGLRDTYGLNFREFVSLDAGGPLTRQALRSRSVDVALLFTTDPAVRDSGYVELEDDLHLQPAENVTPLIRTEAVERWGSDLVELIDDVSAALTTDELRSLNAEVASRGDRSSAVATWLTEQGLS